MTVSAEMLAAYADGELSEFEAGQVRRAIDADPALAQQLAALEGLKAALGAHYDPILAQRVPAALSDPIIAAANVTDLSAARAARQRWFQKPVVRYAALPALAASLLIVVFVGRGGESETASYAAPQLAAVLGGTPSGQAAADGTKPLLSFRDQGGAACRAYTSASGTGIACHDDKGWKLVKTGTASRQSGSEYQQAGSGAEEIMAAAQDMAADGAMAPEEEAAALKDGWTPIQR